jgi:hypothetical protein
MIVLESSESFTIVEIARDFTILFGSHPTYIPSIHFVFDHADFKYPFQSKLTTYIPTFLSQYTCTPVSSVNLFEPISPLPGGWVIDAVPSGGVFACNWRLQRGSENFVICKNIKFHTLALPPFLGSRILEFPNKSLEFLDVNKIIKETLKLHFGDKTVPIFEVSDLDSALVLIGRLLAGSACLKSAPPVVIASERLEKIFLKLSDAYEWLGRDARRVILEGLRDFPQLFARERTEGRLVLGKPRILRTAVMAFAVITTAEESFEVTESLDSQKHVVFKNVRFDFPVGEFAPERLPPDYVTKVETKKAWVKKSDLQAGTLLKVRTDCGGAVVLVRK